MNRKFVVITSIHPPSEAICEFAKWDGWQVVVVGDRKTPKGWSYDNVIYLDMKDQADAFGRLSREIPENTYARKMLGYAYAVRGGAEAIFDSDDDNIPYPDAAVTVDRILREDRTLGTRRRTGYLCINSYALFGAPHCWPRGFPLAQARNYVREGGVDNKPWAVMQFLVDAEPDVDAVYRMTDNRPVHFTRDGRFIIDEGTFCPIDSQATLWLPEAFPLLFLPAGISDRVMDILRGYVAQACLWRAGYAAAFSSPVGFQRRNSHDLLDDFRQEIPLYLHAEKWCRQLMSIGGTGAVDACRSALEELVTMDAIPEKNLALYEGFLSAMGMK
jgi:hypothetical protein